jgi:hypothetical protein
MTKRKLESSTRSSLAILTIVLLFVLQLSVVNAAAQKNAVGGTVLMTCFPDLPADGSPPGIGPPPPCVLPVDVPPQFVSPNPVGRANFTLNADGSVSFNIRMKGLAPNLILTAWISYYFPGPPGTPVPDEIFAGNPPIAAVSAPLAPTTAQFSNGLGNEPNKFFSDSSGSAQLVVTLDYDPFLSGQGPLRNGLSNVTQAAAPAGSIAFQPLCCPNGIPAPSAQPIAASFLRAFDPLTGYQLVGENGRPELIRSPVPVAFLAIVAHLDRQTHGIVPGIPVPPAAGVSASVGDHFLVGMFDLRAFE